MDDVDADGTIDEEEVGVPCPYAHMTYDIIIGVVSVYMVYGI
jgi:hypothetical protein